MTSQEAGEPAKPLKLPPVAHRAIKMVREKKQSSKVVAQQLHVSRTQVLAWLAATAKPRKPGPGRPRASRAPERATGPVRLHVRASGCCVSELVLMRGTATLAVLGRTRAGAWDLSLAGEGKRRSLLAVLPRLEARVTKPKKMASGADAWDQPLLYAGFAQSFGPNSPSGMRMRGA